MARKKSKVIVSKKEEDDHESTSSEEVDASMMDEEGDASSSSHDDADDSNDDEILGSDDNNSNEDDDDESEEEMEGSDNDESESDNSDDDDEEVSDEEMEESESSSKNETETKTKSSKEPAFTSDGHEQCTFDLTNLLAFNTHQINAAELYSTKAKKSKEWYGNGLDGVTIQIPDHPPVNEAALLAKACQGTTQLLRELWKLPVEKKTDVGFLIKLPSVTSVANGGIVIPRALPPPPQKQLTKWEKFALERGISPKSKRSRKQFDEATGEWKHLTGSLATKANAGPESWPIMEVKKNDDPYADPWEKLREEKKGRVTKNTEARMRNAEREGLLDKGTSNRHAKNLKKQDKQRELMRENERKHGLVAPVGVPVDMNVNKEKAGGTEMRGKPSLNLALRATQASTASLGKFDKMREGEPERQFQKNINSKKRKLMLDGSSRGGNTDKKVLLTEAQKGQDILQKVMNGSKEKEKDVKKGKYARGETAYDYDFDDGLGAGSFKKKKGRAGMGKMKKVTKKRIK